MYFQHEQHLADPRTDEFLFLGGPQKSVALSSESWCWCIRTRLGRLKREVFSAPVPNYAMFDSLLAALCDPLIPARVMTVGVPQTVTRPADEATMRPSIRRSSFLA
jgi:hypothetical protein